MTEVLTWIFERAALWLNYITYKVALFFGYVFNAEITTNDVFAFFGVAFIIVTYFWIWGMLIMSFFAACASYWSQKKYLMTLVVGFIVVVFFFSMLSGAKNSLNCFYVGTVSLGDSALICILGGGNE